MHLTLRTSPEFRREWPSLENKYVDCLLVLLLAIEHSKSGIRSVDSMVHSARIRNDLTMQY